MSTIIGRICFLGRGCEGGEAAVVERGDGVCSGDRTQKSEGKNMIW